MEFIKSKFKLIICFLLCLITFFSISSPTYVYAEEDRTYTSVIEDLSKDKNFSLDDYPSYTYNDFIELNQDSNVFNDVSFMDVISIAEGENKELFIYVYNPTRKDLNINAIEISMYLEYAPNPKSIINPKLYPLELVSTESVFDKYLVKNFTVSNDEERYYNIVEISRPFNLKIDVSIDIGFTVDKAISVGKQWCVYSSNGKLIYEMGKFRVLELTVAANGRVNLPSYVHPFGSTINDACDLWFVSFNVDNHVIKHIYDADVCYDIKKYEHNGFFGTTKVLSQQDDVIVTISDKEKVEYNGGGLFSKTFSWQRICSGESLIESFEKKGVNIDSSAKKILEDSQWVFAFLETENNDNISTDSASNVTSGSHIYSKVSGVDIIRVHFIDIFGRQFNLGVVSDKTTPSPDPINNGGGGCNFYTLKQILMLLAFVFLLWILTATGILPILIKIIVFVVTAPFKVIKWIIGKFKTKDKKS